MTKDKTDFEQVVDFGNLYKAYRKSRRGRGFNKSRARFEVTALDGVYQIKRLIEKEEYNVSPYNKFTIYEPKERVIEAGSFKDKIVQHSICDNVLLPLLEPEFIKTNVAGQIGKGTLFGLDCLREHMKAAYDEYGSNCWILKGDIKKYFYSIDHEILKEKLRQLVKDKKLHCLCEKFIDSTEGVGLPLGNQITQVFALLYLSGLDHYITEELGVKYYGRYMDDFYLIIQDRDFAKKCLSKIQNFVSDLKLELNGKTQIIPFKNGIKYCGFHTYVTKEGRCIRKLTNENKRRAMKKYRRMAKLVSIGRLNKQKFYDSYTSWKNHISHGNCIKLGRTMDDYVERLIMQK